MTAAELTVITQQLIAQVASDHAWFSSITDDMNDHAVCLDRLTMETTTNQVEVKATQVESQRLFQMVDLNDTTIKGVLSKHDDLETGGHGLARASSRRSVPPGRVARRTQDVYV